MEISTLKFIVLKRKCPTSPKNCGIIYIWTKYVILGKNFYCPKNYIFSLIRKILSYLENNL